MDGLRSFAGKPGEAVPAVDPDDLKSVWQIRKYVQDHPGERIAVDVGLIEQACKPGANIAAVSYRSNFIRVMRQGDGQPGGSGFSRGGDGSGCVDGSPTV